MPPCFVSPILTRAGAALVVLTCAASVVACNSTVSAPAVPASLTTNGAAQPLGSGTVNTFVTTDASGTPQSIGFRLTRSALSNLPATDTEMPLALPAAAAGTAYKSLVLNWNVHGHPPPGIYDVPHFDFHFYMIDESTRMAISPSDPNALASPPPAAIPTNYVPLAPVVQPMMGVHWIDPASPEFHGTPFTTTFIYGFDDAKLIFSEAMITTAFLATNPSFTAPVAQPQTYPIAGVLYPTSYSVNYDASSDSYIVALTGLVKH